MTIQITVRLPDPLVEFVDEQVAAGAASRAAVVAQALRHEQRLQADMHDVAIYAALAGQPDPDDLAGLAAWATTQPMELD